MNNRGTEVPAHATQVAALKCRRTMGWTEVHSAGGRRSLSGLQPVVAWAGCLQPPECVTAARGACET